MQRTGIAAEELAGRRQRLLDHAGTTVVLFDRYNEVYGRHFPDPKPVRTTVGASLLHGMLIEITVTARRP